MENKTKGATTMSTNRGFWMWLLRKLYRTGQGVWPSIANWWRTPENQNSSLLALGFINFVGTLLLTVREGYYVLLWLIPTAFIFLYYSYRTEQLKGANIK